MLIQNYTTDFLNLEDVIITKAENFSDQLHIHLQLPRKTQLCPCCGASTDCVHDYRQQVIKDIPLGRTTFLHLRKRRYRCTSCGKRFAEKNTFLCKELPGVLSIDEFKGNAGGQKYQSILADPENRRIVDILPNR